MYIIHYTTSIGIHEGIMKDEAGLQFEAASAQSAIVTVQCSPLLMLVSHFANSFGS